MLKTILYYVVRILAKAHTEILRLNDRFELALSDKMLHFLVIGVLGMLIVFVIHPLFTQLAKHDHVLVITWVYVFTLILVLTFAIEIGQGYTGQGTMDFEDIVFGIGGFILLFLVFAVIRGFVRFMGRVIRKE